MRNLKIFAIEKFENTLCVTPQGEGSAFRYQDLHIETNTLRAELGQPGVKNLIIDLSTMEYFGSEFIGALVTLLREVRNRGGKACFCSAKPQMLQVLQNMSLFRLWPHYDTRAEALQALGAA